MQIYHLLTEEEFLLKKLYNNFNSTNLLDYLLTNNYILSEDVLIKYCDILNINEIIQYQTLSNDFIDFLLFKKNINNYENLILYQHLDFNQINFILQQIKTEQLFNTLFNNQIINDNIFLKYSNEFLKTADKNAYSINKFSVTNILSIYNNPYFHMNKFLKYMKFSENDLSILLNQSTSYFLHMHLICQYQIISEDFIIKYQNYITPMILQDICKYQKLSKSFIEKNISCFNGKAKINLKVFQNYNGNLNVQYNPHSLLKGD